MLRDFKDLAFALVGELERAVDGRYVFGKLNINDGTNYLNNTTL